MHAERVGIGRGFDRVGDPPHDVLVEAARNGDQAAFARLVAIHQHNVFTLALRLVADRELAADITQNALLRAWRAMPTFRGEARFSTWLHRITVNTAYSTRRRWRRGETANLECAAEIVDGSAGPERLGISSALHGQLHAALLGLCETRRSVIVLKDIYEWSHPEIAEHLGISVTAAKVRLHRARKQLRQLLAAAVDPSAGENP